QHRIEDECRKLSGGQASGYHIVATDPQDHADRAEHQNDDGGNEQSALANPSLRSRERVFDAIGEQLSINGLMPVSLHGTHFMERLIDVRTNIADAILACARE